MYLLFWLLDAYSLVVIVSAVLTWFPVPRNHPVVELLNSLTEPVYAPIRRVLAPSSTGGMDFSPLIVLLGIHLIKQMLVG